MKKNEKIAILEKEVTRLNELLKQSSAMKFERLKEQMEQEVKTLREYQEKYRLLIEDAKKLKAELEDDLRITR